MTVEQKHASVRDALVATIEQRDEHLRLANEHNQKAQEVNAEALKLQGRFEALSELLAEDEGADESEDDDFPAVREEAKRILKPEESKRNPKLAD